MIASISLLAACSLPESGLLLSLSWTGKSALLLLGDPGLYCYCFELGLPFAALFLSCTLILSFGICLGATLALI